MGGRLSEQERLHYDQYIQVPCSCVLSNTINHLHSYSDCDLNKFWQFILEQSIQVYIFTGDNGADYIVLEGGDFS